MAMACIRRYLPFVLIISALYCLVMVKYTHRSSKLESVHPRVKNLPNSSIAFRANSSEKMIHVPEKERRQTVTHISETTSGPSELAQLKYFLYDCDQACQQKLNRSRSEFRHVVHSGVHEDGRPYIKIQEYEINEPLAGRDAFKPSRGGSNFRVEINGSNYRLLCSLTDHFNGTYTGVCPKIYSCVKGIVYLDYTHFEAYKQHGGSGGVRWWPGRIHKEIHFFSLCSSNKLPNLLENRGDCKKRSVWEYVKGRWWREKNATSWRDNKIRWGTEDGCLLPLMTSDELTKCFNDSQKHVCFYGDSHLRNTHDLLRNQLREILPTKTVLSSLNVLSGHYIDQIVKMINISVSSSNSTLTSKDVVVINFGIWDLVFRKAEKLINEFPIFIDSIKRLKSDRRTRALRVIYLNIFPRFRGDKDANYYMIPAIYEMYRPKLEAMGVEVVDAFSILNPMLDTTCDYVHFVCSDDVSQTGLIFSNLLFRLICNDSNFKS